MPWYLLVIASLGVWRLTHLLSVEDGPGAVFRRMREAAGNGIWRGALDCFQCLSLWVAIPFALAVGARWPEVLLLWPALSAAAILLERLNRGVEPAIYLEDEQQPRE